MNLLERLNDVFLIEKDVMDLGDIGELKSEPKQKKSEGSEKGDSSTNAMVAYWRQNKPGPDKDLNALKETYLPVVNDVNTSNWEVSPAERMAKKAELIEKGLTREDNWTVEEVALACMPIIMKYAKQYESNQFPFDDGISHGALAVMEMIRTDRNPKLDENGRLDIAPFGLRIGDRIKSRIIEAAQEAGGVIRIPAGEYKASKGRARELADAEIKKLEKTQPLSDDEKKEIYKHFYKQEVRGGMGTKHPSLDMPVGQSEEGEAGTLGDILSPTGREVIAHWSEAAPRFVTKWLKSNKRWPIEIKDAVDEVLGGRQHVEGTREAVESLLVKANRMYEQGMEPTKILDRLSQIKEVPVMAATASSGARDIERHLEHRELLDKAISLARLNPTEKEVIMLSYDVPDEPFEYVEDEEGHRVWVPSRRTSSHEKMSYKEIAKKLKDEGKKLTVYRLGKFKGKQVRIPKEFDPTEDLVGEVKQIALGKLVKAAERMKDEFPEGSMPSLTARKRAEFYKRKSEELQGKEPQKKEMRRDEPKSKEEKPVKKLSKKEQEIADIKAFMALPPELKTMSPEQLALYRQLKSKVQQIKPEEWEEPEEPEKLEKPGKSEEPKKTESEPEMELPPEVITAYEKLRKAQAEAKKKKQAAEEKMEEVDVALHRVLTEMIANLAVLSDLSVLNEDEEMDDDSIRSMIDDNDFTPDEKKIIEMIYGLNDGVERDVEEIAAILGMRPQQVMNMRDVVIAKLTNAAQGSVVETVQKLCCMGD